MKGQVIEQGGPSDRRALEEAADYRERAGRPVHAGAGELTLAAAPERRSARVSALDHGQRLDRLLVAMAPEFSRSHLQRLAVEGHVRLDGTEVVTASRRVKVDQYVEVDLVPTDESRAYLPQAMDLDVVYEDAHLLVVDKPVGLVVHPAPGHWSSTLLNGLLARHAAAAALPRAGIVHRLDKDTSGLMVVAKSTPAVTALVRAIAARQVQREYLALVHGRVGEQALQIDAPIGRDPVSRVRMAVVAGGKEARTDVMPLAFKEGVTAVRCKLHSGRTHQIRVHLSSRGHALVGDSLYGGRPCLGLDRQALHAWRLQFSHPADGRWLSFEVPPPPDFAAAWRAVIPEPWEGEGSAVPSA